MVQCALYYVCYGEVGAYLCCGGISAKSLFISFIVPGEGGGGKPSADFSALLP